MSGGKFNLCLVCRDVGAHAPSGLVRATCDLADALAESGHTVHLLSDRSAAPPPELTAASFEPLTVPVASGQFREAEPETARHNLMHAAAVYRAVKRIHEQEQPVDAVLAPLWRSEGAICLLDDRFPTVVSCMTSLRTLTEVDDSYQQLEDIEERLTLEREALSRSRYLHGLTQASLSKTISDYELAPVATAVVGRGIRDRHKAGTHGIRDRHKAGTRDPAGGRPGPPQILFVGRIERRKGVDTLLDAMGKLLDDGIEAHLTLAGPITDPGFHARLEQEVAHRPRFSEVVLPTGAVPDGELARLYADADIVCLPSRYESHGIVLIEAMMFGKPIVTCDAGGISEVVDPDRDALLSAPEDSSELAASLRRLLTDRALRAQLGAEARATFQRRFDVSGVARHMESFLADVIEIHLSAQPTADDVSDRLSQLLRDVLGLEPQGAVIAAAELLDPAAGEPLRQLTAAASRTRRRTPPKGASRVAAIVLSRNRPELLARTLDSLDESETPVETLVIDDGSTPANARRLAAVCAGRSGLRVRRSERNLGTAAGRQLGIDLTDSELVLFLDDDAQLLPGALGHLVGELDDHPAVGAVTATVVSSDGLVFHSGGSLNRAANLVNFDLIGHGTEFDPEALPPSGEAGWVPGTVALFRRALLEEFPIDGQMAAYFEDNEWCYRVGLARPGTFRRSREALAFHQGMPFAPGDSSWTAIVHRVRLLAATARFYERHDALLAPAVLQLVPELRADDGTYDLGSMRMLMEILAAKPPERIAAAWSRGDLATLLQGRRRSRRAEAGLEHAHAQLEHTHAQLERAQGELEQLRRAVAAQEQTLDFLRSRHEVLCMVEEGGWWRLRGRILPLIRVAGGVRRRLRGVDHHEPR